MKSINNLHDAAVKVHLICLVGLSPELTILYFNK